MRALKKKVMLIVLTTIMSVMFCVPTVSASSLKTLVVTTDMNGGKLGGKRKIDHYGSSYNGVIYGEDAFAGNGYSFPYRKGYAFVNYYYDKKGTKPVKSEYQALRKAAKKRSGKITIYAKWTPKCCKITFVPGSKGIFDFRTQKVTKKKVTAYIQKGKAVCRGIAPYAFGYVGNYTIKWYKDKALKREVDWSKLKATKNMKLYAKYVKE